MLTEQARTFSKVCDISATNFRRQIAALKSPRALQKTEEIQHIGESGRKGGYRPAASVATPQWRIRRDARLRGVAQYRSSTSAFRRQWNSLVLPSFFVPKGEPQRRTRQQHWRDRFEGAPGQKTDRDCQGATLAGRHLNPGQPPACEPMPAPAVDTLGILNTTGVSIRCGVWRTAAGVCLRRRSCLSAVAPPDRSPKRAPRSPPLGRS